jgi:hypothetical protein
MHKGHNAKTVFRDALKKEVSEIIPALKQLIIPSGSFEHKSFPGNVFF